MAAEIETCLLCTPYRARLSENYDPGRAGCLVDQFMESWTSVEGKTNRNKRFNCYSLTSTAMGFRFREPHAFCILEAVRNLYPDEQPDVSVLKKTANETNESSNETIIATATESTHMILTDESTECALVGDPPVPKRQRLE